jgi:hypothetical protein
MTPVVGYCKKMANIRMLRRALGLKFKGNRTTGEINVYENKIHFSMMLREK